MLSTKLTGGTSSLVANAIQRIAVTASVVSEQQVRKVHGRLPFIFLLNNLAIYL